MSWSRQYDKWQIDEILMAAVILGAAFAVFSWRRWRQLGYETRQRQRAERVLRGSEARFRALFDEAPVGYHELDTQGRIVRVNRTELDMLGYTAEEMVGQPMWEFVVEREMARQSIWDKISGVKPPGQAFERTLRRKDGTTFPVLIESHLLHDESGQIIGLRSTIQDITERKQMEEQMRAERDRAQVYLDIAGVMFVALNTKGEVTLINQRGCRVLGYEREEIIGQNWFDNFLPVSARDAVKTVFHRLMAGEIEPVERHENPVLTKSGEERVIAWHNIVVRDERGNIIGTLSSGEDITERKRAEEALRESEERYRTLFEGVPMGLYRTTAEGQIVDANPALVDMLGYPDRESVLALNAAEVYVDPEDRRREQALLECEGIVRSHEMQLRRREGMIIWVRDTVRAVRNGDGRVLYYEGSLEDITERKRAEEALRGSEARFRALFDEAPVGYHELDTEGRIIRVNRTELDMLGYTAEEMVGQPMWEFVVEREMACQSIKDKILGVKPLDRAFERTFRRKDGTTFPVLIESHLLHDESGQIIGLRSTIQDITERKRMEEQMWAQERLAAVGQLAAGIAHDFNNILTGMMGCAELVHMRADVPESAKPDLKHIMEGGQRAARLIRQILDFSRKSLIWPRPLDLAAFLEEAVRFLQHTIPESVHIVLEMGPEEYGVHGDSAQLQQALTNLAVNARDAMPGGGELRLRLSRIELKRGDRRLFANMEPGEWITLSVSDTGVGIPPDALPHLYEPFFTTKAPGEGTGLGLAQVYGIVKQHQGFIDVETEVGKGTTFIIYLPPLAGQEEALREEVPEEIPHGRGETILVVEDEPQVLRVSQALLEHLGYRALTAPTGEQALEVYERHGEEIALVLADMVMPQMGGVELYQALRVRNPEVKVVLMTGYPLGGAEDRELLEQGIVDWMLKPLGLVQLAQVMRRTLR